jgi:hypothetical protein
MLFACCCFILYFCVVYIILYYIILFYFFLFFFLFFPVHPLILIFPEFSFQINATHALAYGNMAIQSHTIKNKE